MGVVNDMFTNKPMGSEPPGGWIDSSTLPEHWISIPADMAERMRKPIDDVWASGDIPDNPI